MKKNIIDAYVDMHEREKKQLVEDMHDSIGQQLTVIKFYFKALEKTISVPNTNVRKLLSKSNQIIDDTLIELRKVCSNLAPATLHNFGLKHAVNELSSRIEFDGLLKFDIEIDNKFSIPEKSLEITIYRIIQEFINNAIKHGNAKTIFIKINRSIPKKMINIRLKDDGKGFVAKNITEFEGRGLKNIKSRVDLYKGNIKIQSSSKGTVLQISIPQ